MNNLNYVFIGFIVLMVIFIIIGICKGFVTMVFSLFSTLIVIGITLSFAPKVGILLRNIEPLENAIVNLIDSKLEIEGTVSSSMTQADVIEALPIPKIVAKLLASGKADKIVDPEGATTMQEYVVNMFTTAAFTIIGFLLTFIIASIAVFMLVKLLDVISKLPVLKQLNGLLGGVIGAMEGLVVTWFLFLVLTLFTGTSFGITLLKMIEQNGLLKWMYENNLISTFLLKLTESVFG
ncbi:MAG: CvpA family protein [Lachnospiraceae bacterium]|nr:CvpA family protein [Lachnospiraceae bacterium]